MTASSTSRSSRYTPSRTRGLYCDRYDAFTECDKHCWIVQLVDQTWTIDVLKSPGPSARWTSIADWITLRHESDSGARRTLLILRCNAASQGLERIINELPRLLRSALDPSTQGLGIIDNGHRISAPCVSASLSSSGSSSCASALLYAQRFCAGATAVGKELSAPSSPGNTCENA